MGYEVDQSNRLTTLDLHIAALRFAGRRHTARLTDTTVEPWGTEVKFSGNDESD